jgi:hypothetical protein
MAPADPGLVAGLLIRGREDRRAARLAIRPLDSGAAERDLVALGRAHPGAGAITRLVDNGAGPEVDLDDPDLDPRAREVIRRLRGFELRTHRVWLDAGLNVRGRQVALSTLLAEARRTPTPELACRAIERVTFAHIFGGEDDEFVRARLEVAIVRDVERGLAA